MALSTGNAAPRRAIGLLASLALISACAPRDYHDIRSVSVPTAGQALSVPGGDYRMIFSRPDPEHPGGEVLCAEPAPDWATASSSSRALSAAANGPAGPQASVGASVSDATTIAQMLGRSAGVVALRDGLYQACQAYANRLLSADDYALILSQYGTLLVALVGSGSAGSGAAASSGAAAANAHIQALLVTCLRVYETDDPRNVALRRILDPATCTKLIKDIGGLASHLLDDAAAPAKPKPDAPAGPACTDADKQSAGEPVALVQFALKLAKAYSGPLDGKDGPLTKAAVLSYQTSNKLCACGIVNLATATKLGF